MFFDAKLDKDIKALEIVSESLRAKRQREIKRQVKTNPARPEQVQSEQPPPEQARFEQPVQRKPRKDREDHAFEYSELRKRVIGAIADNFIFDVRGREMYKKTASAYAIVGKFKVSADFIDYDHELRDINVMAGGQERNRTLRNVARRLGVRT